MKFGAVVNSSGVKDAFSVTAKQLPYVAAIVLTKLAGDAKSALVTKMPEVFDRPTDFTKRGVYTQSAAKSKLESFVFVPNSLDEQGKSAREYIRPGAQGSGGRRQKRTEYLLTRMGALPYGWVSTPGKGATLDAYGNIGGSVYKQIINVLQIRGDAKPVSARSVKGAKRLGVASLFFVVAPGANKLAKNGGWLPPGVWKHLSGGRITQILKFVRRASYKPRLDFEAVSAQSMNENILTRWNESAAVIAERFSRARPG